MTNLEIIQVVEDEVTSRRWGVTEQFLAIHSLVYNDGKLLIERIDREKKDGPLIAYLPVKDEEFFLAIYVSAAEYPEVCGIEVAPYCEVSFNAYSDVLNAGQLTTLTKLKVTDSWNKGDSRKVGTTHYKESRIRIIPTPEPDAFEDKLNKLLGYLELDKVGVKLLVDKAEGHIQASMIMHNGNTMLGGPYLSKDAISRLSKLNLEMDFDLYATGNFYK